MRDVNVGEYTEGPVSARDVDLTDVKIAGFGWSWPQVNGGDILAGRNFTAIEYAAGARVAVINDKLAESLFPGLDPIGKQIKIYGVPFDVVGMHAEAASLFSSADEPRLAIPHTTFRKVTEYWPGWMEIAVIPTEAATVAEAQDQVTAALRSRRGLRPAEDNNFSLVTSDRVLDAFNKITAGFFIAMISLSSVGLMVGGVGVVAIMMISVTERTREIGVRKALGATRGEIMFQFLVEAATLTLVGCLIGMALGAGVAWAVRSFTPVPASVPLRLGGRGGGGVDPDGSAVRALPGEQGLEAGSGGGVEIRVVRRYDGTRSRDDRRTALPPLPPLPAYFPAMPLTEALRLAVQAIWTSKLRSFFTLLGILVSVAFLVVVVAVIQGMNAYVSGTLTASMIGTNTFQVRRGPISVGLMDDDQVREIAKRPLVTVEDAEAVAAAVPEAVAVGAPVGLALAGGGDALPRPHRRQRGHSGRHGALPGGPGLHATSPARRSPTRTSATGAPSSALGHEIADKLFDDPLSAVGKRVRLDGREVTVKGVIAPKGRLLGQSFDAFVLLPFSTFEAAYGPRKTTVVSIKMPTAEAIESGMAQGGGGDAHRPPPPAGRGQRLHGGQGRRPDRLLEAAHQHPLHRHPRRGGDRHRGRRDRHHEHHADDGERAHPRDRPPQSPSARPGRTSGGSSWSRRWCSPASAARSAC